MLYISQQTSILKNCNPCSLVEDERARKVTAFQIGYLYFSSPDVYSYIHRITQSRPQGWNLESQTESAMKIFIDSTDYI